MAQHSLTSGRKTESRPDLFSRRRLLSGALIAPALFLASPVMAGLSMTDHAARRLREALARYEPPVPGGQLDLIGVAQRTGGGPRMLHATVRLTWAPGQRHRSFSTDDTRTDDAVEALAAEIHASFAALA